MPKITTITRYITNRQEKMTVNYSSKSKQFTIRLPAEIESIVNKKHAFGKTQEECEYHLNKLLDQYEQSKQTIKKCIMFEFMFNAAIMENEKCVFAANDISFFNGDIAIGMVYKIIDEINIDGKIRYKDHKTGRLESKYDWEHINIVTWTQQREDFLKMIKNQLENIVLKIHEFISTEDKFIETVNSGLKLLTE